MHDVIVVGGGIFGSVAAAHLRSGGKSVLVLDDARPLSGSAAAGCLMKPSWLNAMGSKLTDEAFAELDHLYGLRELKFGFSMSTVSVFWVPPPMVVDVGAIPEKVIQISGTTAETESGQTYEAKNVIVAAGAWTSALLPEIEVTPKIGVSVRLNQPPEDNRIKVWAPYKQLVRFGAEGFFWGGDGSAIKQSNWTEERKNQSLRRIEDFAGPPAFSKTGLRPYCKTGDDPALIREVRPGVWVLTGGAKIGMAAAAWAAIRLGEKL